MVGFEYISILEVFDHPVPTITISQQVFEFKTGLCVIHWINKNTDSSNSTRLQLLTERTNLAILRYPRPFSKGQLGRVAKISRKTLRGSAISNIVRVQREALETQDNSKIRVTLSGMIEQQADQYYVQYHTRIRILLPTVPDYMTTISCTGVGGNSELGSRPVTQKLWWCQFT